MGRADDPTELVGGAQDPAAQAAATPLRGDLVCRSLLPPHAVDDVQTGPERRPDKGSTDRTRRPEPVADPGLGEVLVAARHSPGAHRGGGHSPLYEWLWARFEALSGELSPPRRPNWRSVADAMAARAAAGDTSVLDGWGEAPGPETIRQTWWRVRKDKAAVLARDNGGQRPGEPGGRRPRRTPGAPTPPPIPHASTQTPQPPPLHRFGSGVRPKAWVPPRDSSEE